MTDVSTASINWSKSAALNDCTIDELEARFERFPESNKRIIAICEGCAIEREMRFGEYGRWCMWCARNLNGGPAKYHGTMNINWSKTAEINGTDTDELKEYFKRFPQSSKQIIAICEDCGIEREIIFAGYHKLCQSCARNLPESIEAQRLGVIQYYIDHPEAIEAARLKTIEQFSDPEAREANRLRVIEHWSDPEARKRLSDILKNSEAAKTASEKQIGGHDILNHHHIYDHDDLSKYTIEMTRSEHTTLHWNMRDLGLKVPHINTGHEDVLKLMEYIKQVII